MTHEFAVQRLLGPELDPKYENRVKEAVMRLCDHDKDRAKTLWARVYGVCGYMPAAAAIALEAAADVNPTPFVPAQEPE